jgi:uncharacterized protein (TIGR02118 family)
MTRCLADFTEQTAKWQRLYIRSDILYIIFLEQHQPSPSSQYPNIVTLVFNTTFLSTNTTTLAFDLSYYLSNHWSLVSKKWGLHGFDWKVLQIKSTPGDSDKQQHRIGATLNFRDEASFTALMGAEDWKTVMGDIPNFCNEQPLVIVGDIVESS